MMNTEESQADKAVNALTELAMELETTDPIDWEDLEVDAKTAFKMMASRVIEQMGAIPEDQQQTVALATIVKLLVENFMLNVKIAKE